MSTPKFRGLWQSIMLAAGVAFATSSLAQTPPSAAGAPIKIGVMFPLTGPIAANGKASRDAVRQAFEERQRHRAGARCGCSTRTARASRTSA